MSKLVPRACDSSILPVLVIPMITRPMPRFDSPPVLETALSAAFSPLEGWGVPHFGILWSRIRDQFPEFKVHPPLEAEVEKFGSAPVAEPAMQFQLLDGLPEPRCWFLHQDKSQLIQVQRDRFVYNWRRSEEDAKYPGYDEFIKPHLNLYWTAFVDVLRQERIPAPEVHQCEVTYVNFIPENEGWKQISDWWKVFPFLAEPVGLEFLPPAESQRFNINYVIPESKGRLRISAVYGVVNGQKGITLNVTARGKPNSTTQEEMFEWLDLGREWVVRGFADFTSKEMHKIWKRK